MPEFQIMGLLTPYMKLAAAEGTHAVFPHILISTKSDIRISEEKAKNAKLQN